MFSTTLRIEESLGIWLQAAARQRALSVNAFLAELIRREQALAAQRRLASDWAAFARDPEAQDVEYALRAQADLAAEPTRPKAKANPRARRGR